MFRTLAARPLRVVDRADTHRPPDRRTQHTSRDAQERRRPQPGTTTPPTGSVLRRSGDSGHALPRRGLRPDRRRPAPPFALGQPRGNEPTARRPSIPHTPPEDGRPPLRAAGWSRPRRAARVAPRGDAPSAPRAGI